MISRERLVSDLRRMGVRPGDALIVHSSYRAIAGLPPGVHGRPDCGVEGGPTGVVEALKEAVGPAGLLAMPTFTFGRFGVFSVADSSSQTGAVTEAFRLSPGVQRSAHPTHAMALWGQGAEEVARAHLETAGLDVGSPYHLASLRPGALILLIGVDNTANSFIHVCEAIVDLPYAGRVYWHGRQRAYAVVHLDGRRERRVNLRTPGCSKGFAVVDRELERRGQLRREAFGAGPCLALRPIDVLEAVRALTSQRPEALLCSDPFCGFCPEARKAVRAWRRQR
jgi:aminoglycoside N3'-acetyltransferase